MKENAESLNWQLNELLMFRKLIKTKFCGSLNDFKLPEQTQMIKKTRLLGLRLE